MPPALLAPIAVAALGAGVFRQTPLTAAEPARKAASARPAPKTPAAKEASQAEEKPQDGAPGDQDFLRYLPDDCHVFGRGDFQTVLRSEAALRAKSAEWMAFAKWRESVEPSGLEIGQIEWIVIGASRLLPVEKTQTVAVYRSRKALPAADSPGRRAAPGWQRENVGPFELYVEAGPSYPGFAKPRAVCRADDRTVLAGDADALRAVLRRERPARLPERLDRARQSLDPSKPLAIAMVLRDKIEVPEIASLLIARELLPRIEAVRIEAGFTADDPILLSGKGASWQLLCLLQEVPVALPDEVKAGARKPQEP